MGMAAILVMWPGQLIQIFIPPSQGCSMWSLTLNGQAVSKKKMSEHCERTTTTTTTDARVLVYYKLTFWASRLRWAKNARQELHLEPILLPAQKACSENYSGCIFHYVWNITLVSWWTPEYISNLFTMASEIHNRNLRSAEQNILTIPYLRTCYSERSFSIDGAKRWNALPLNIRSSNSIQAFKTSLKGHLAV